jgi:BirA family biotin operon repressor/biotin-[acetyl-CoA-carboxylase] ligase
MALILFPGAVPDPLTPERVQAGLRTRCFGRRVLHWPTVGSTNDEARSQAGAGAPEGLLVLAEEQTAGRGRYDRCWEAPFGSGILASLLLRPTFLPAEQAFLLTALAALGVAEAVEQAAALPVALKWPNDVLVGGRKVCGILVELEGDAGVAPTLAWAVLGWGLNVNVDFSADPELRKHATSLAETAGRPFPRQPLLRTCLERMEAHYDAVRAGRGEEVWAAWRARLNVLGQEVEVAAPEGSFAGVALDVAPDGTLLVQREAGRVERVLAGDVTVRQGT